MQKGAGAKASLEIEPRWRFLDELKIRYSKKAPVLLEYKMKPVRGLKLKTLLDPKTRVRCSSALPRACDWIDAASMLALNPCAAGHPELWGVGILS